MKKSKKYLVNLLLKIANKYFTEDFYSQILFLRTFKKFKKEINKEKSLEKFSQTFEEINKFEYKITSQNNEDGIIDHIFSKVPNNRFFVEIGFSFYEFNSLNLIKKGWSGKLIDFNKDNCLVLKKLLNFFFPKSDVKIINKKVLKDNINQIIQEKLDNKKKIIDFFSLDIDGNDYWILKELDLENINVICCEYNHYLGNNIKKTIPYNPNHEFKNDGCHGASLKAFSELLESRGFNLIAVESSGTNAFFVKKEFAHNFEILSDTKSWKTADRNNSPERIKLIKNSIKNFKFYEF